MTWRTILFASAVASAAVVGCTVNATVNGGDGGLFEDSGTGAKGSGGKATGGSSGSGGSTSGGSSGTGGKATGGTGGASTGGSKGDAAPDGPGPFTVCSPDKTKMCDNCVQTKCCEEWLDCSNDADCLKTVSGKDGEFICIQDCLIGDGGSFEMVADCAGKCQHSSTVSSATSSLIACMRDTGDSGTKQNCTTECFGRDLP